VRILDSNGVDISAQFTISLVNWPTKITIQSKALPLTPIFAGLAPSGTLYITVHLDSTYKGQNLPSEFIMKGGVYTQTFSCQADIHTSMGPTGSATDDTCGNVAFLSKKVTMIYGFITDASGNPVPGATVELKQNGATLHTDITDEDGFYCFFNGEEISPGITLVLTNGVTYTAICHQPPGYEIPSSKSVTAKKDTAVVVNFSLKKTT
jgi:hypothetical protein